MISRRQAAMLGVTYVPGTEGTAAPRLAGVPADLQFRMTVGGIGASKTSAGLYLDRLVLRTTEGRTITYLHAPVLVADITVRDRRSGATATLDGVFSMTSSWPAPNCPRGQCRTSSGSRRACTR